MFSEGRHRHNGNIYDLNDLGLITDPSNNERLNGLRTPWCSGVDVFTCIASAGTRPAAVYLAGFGIDPAAFAGLWWNIPLLVMLVIIGAVG